MKEFYIGVETITNIPYAKEYFMFSITQLMKRKTNFDSMGKTWMLDSGGFTMLHKYGKYLMTVEEYLKKVDFLKPTYFIIMDWMCEPTCICKTGKTVKKHIELTVQNHINIKDKNYTSSQLVGSIQGWNIEDYLYCIDLLKKYGLIEERMALGTMCKRQKSSEMIKYITIIRENLPSWVKLHGLGIKIGFFKYFTATKMLYSADSMAWSYEARFLGKCLKDKMNNCLINNMKCFRKSKNCANCGVYMRDWLERVEKIINYDKSNRNITEWML